MPATIVVGGQYGSEGKGKTVALLAARTQNPWLVRCGGPNSGHTVTIDGTDVVLRQVPSSTEPHNGIFCMSAGCVVDEVLLLNELDLLKIERERIIVDPRAVIVTDADKATERAELHGIASTCSGTGAALIRRMSRSHHVPLAGASPSLRKRCRVEMVAPLLHHALDDGGNVIIEGTQGFGLSLLHGPNYPYVTSRDTTAAGFAMEAGLSPRMIDQIVLVVRTFPIRVGGTSGPFANETSWDEIQRISGSPTVVKEYTSVTRRLRRVAQFDLELVRLACAYNQPTALALMGVDRLDYRITGATELSDLTTIAQKFVGKLELATHVPILFLGTGFGTLDVITMPVKPHSLTHA